MPNHDYRASPRSWPRWFSPERSGPKPHTLSVAPARRQDECLCEPCASLVPPTTGYIHHRVAAYLMSVYESIVHTARIVRYG